MTIHPGKFLYEMHIKDLPLTNAEVADMLHMPYTDFCELIDGRLSLYPELALRLEIVFGTPADNLIAMQYEYYLAELDRLRI